MHIENLIVARLNKTFHAFYGTLKFDNKFNNAVTESYPKPQEFSLTNLSAFLADLPKSNPAV
jgi:hypothetical protein